MMHLHMRRQKMKYEEEFTAWLYENFTINNDDALIHHLKDGQNYDTFLFEMGLEDE